MKARNRFKFRAWDGKVMLSVDTLEFPIGGIRWHGPGVGGGICHVNKKFVKD